MTQSCIYIHFLYYFPYGLYQEIGHSSLCYTGRPYCVSILNIIAFASTHPKLPGHPTPSLLPVATTGLLSMQNQHFKRFSQFLNFTKLFKHVKAAHPKSCQFKMPSI